MRADVRRSQQTAPELILLAASAAAAAAAAAVVAVVAAAAAVAAVAVVAEAAAAAVSQRWFCWHVLCLLNQATPLQRSAVRPTDR